MQTNIYPYTPCSMIIQPSSLGPPSDSTIRTLNKPTPTHSPTPPQRPPAASPLEGSHLAEAAPRPVHAVEIPVLDDVVESAGDEPGSGRIRRQRRHRLRAVLQRHVGGYRDPAARILCRGGGVKDEGYRDPAAWILSGVSKMDTGIQPRGSCHQDATPH